MSFMANANVRIGLLGFAVIIIVILLIFALHVVIPLWAMALLGIAAMAALLLPG